MNLVGRETSIREHRRTVDLMAEIISGDPGSLNALVERIGDISTLPDVAFKVMAIAKDEKAGASDLTRAIEGDPALSSKVLRTVNSATYPVRARITNLKQAITYLGFDQVRNLALSLSVSKLFKPNERIGSYEREKLWRHCVSVAIGARFFALRCELPDYEDAYVAGLLHDIGIILEDQYVHASFRKVIAALTEGRTLSQVEHEIMGFDHTEIGYRVSREWRFPEPVRAAIRFHHASHNYEDQHSEIVKCVDLANVIITLSGTSSVGLRIVDPDFRAIDGLGLKREDSKEWIRGLRAEVAHHQPLFELL